MFFIKYTDWDIIGKIGMDQVYSLGSFNLGISAKSGDNIQVAERIFNSDYYKNMPREQQIMFGKMVAGRREMQREILNRQQADFYGSLDTYGKKQFAPGTFDDPIRGQRLDTNRFLS